MRKVEDEYLKPKEVAEILKVCQRTVLNMIKEGKIRAIEVSNHGRLHYRILASELDRFVAEEYQRLDEQFKKIRGKYDAKD